MKWQLETILFIFFFSLLFKNIAGVPKLTPVPSHGMFVSVVFLEVQRDHLRGLIRECKVSYL